MRLARIFGDHAVLQRDRPIPVWGWTAPRRRVRVTLADAVGETLSDDEGRFLLRLPPRPAGGPYTLRAATRAEGGGPGADGEDAAVESADVRVGEVWLASGQSNMRMSLDATGWTPPAGAAARPDEVRMFTVPPCAGPGRASDVDADWTAATPETVGAFSAVAHHFAVELARALGVPVGILHASWGGTVAEAWTSRRTLARNPALDARLQRLDLDASSPDFWKDWSPVDRLDHAGALQALRRRCCPPDPGNRGAAEGWARPDHDDRAAPWGAMDLPAPWTRRGHDTNGVFWFRRDVDVPEGAAGRDLALALGGADKHDVTYWNGEEVGRTGRGLDDSVWNVDRRYVVPGRLVRPGRNVLAVRVYSFLFDGGLIGPAMTATPGGAAPVDLAGAWRYRIEADFGRVNASATPFPPGPGNPNTPAILFDRMIAPLVPYALRGVIWYQGESNVDHPEGYRRLVVDLARDWQDHWLRGEFPFIQVQLASYGPPEEFHAGSKWARLREAQREAVGVAGIGMATAIDAGEAADIHPKDKKTVGDRLADWALAKAYGRTDRVAHGPHYAGMILEGSRVRIRFTGTEGGLRTRDGRPPATVWIADDAGAWRAARAVIEEDTLVAWHPEVSAPTGLRYAWADHPAGANLVNGAGLPAPGFRTDRED